MLAWVAGSRGGLPEGGVLLKAPKPGQDLRVEGGDDGTGIDPDAARSGLRNLEERARECGGRFAVTAAPGRGTRLSWHVPL